MIADKLKPLADLIPEIDSSKRYWFIRTNGGKNFGFYYNNNMVCIGHNRITAAKWRRISKIKKKTKREACLKKLIFDKYNDHELRYRNKVFRQLNAFLDEMKTGDYVIIPNRASKQLLIGELVGNEIGSQAITNEKGTRLCLNKKFRRVEWKKRVNRDSLSSMLYKEFFSQHAVLDLTDHSVELESNVHDIFKHNGKYHIYCRVGSRREINGRHLNRFLLNIMDVNDIILKSNNLYVLEIELHSPGFAKFAIKTGAVAAAFWIIMNAFSGGKFEFGVLGKALYLKAETRGAIEAVSEAIEKHDKAKTMLSEAAEQHRELEIANVQFPEAKQQEKVKK